MRESTQDRLNPVDTRMRAGFFGMLILLLRNRIVVFITTEMEHDKRNLPLHRIRLNPIDTRVRAGFFGMVIPPLRNRTVVFITTEMEHDKRNLPLHKTP